MFCTDKDFQPERKPIDNYDELKGKLEALVKTKSNFLELPSFCEVHPSAYTFSMKVL